MTNARNLILWLLLSSVGFSSLASAETRTVVILYTNDFHSAIDPIPAYWMNQDPVPHLGGAAQLMTMVKQIREHEAKAGNPVFLFDTGDMFTGMLSKLTQGEVLMEMMTTLGYDAMAIGNHELDYGWENFRKQMFRAPFPVLGANIFYKESDIPYSRPHTVVERDGVRLGVIGVIGQDARSVVLPSLVTELDFRDPAPYVQASIQELGPDVDLIVVLAHQGQTGPMQTDAEAHPDIQRDFDEDIGLCSKVPGIDVFVGGHAHRGIEEPFVHPKTGSIIVQTYGYGTRLGLLRVTVDMEASAVVSHTGELLKVWSDELEPDSWMSAKMAKYKKEVESKIGTVVGHASTRLTRSYNAESLLGAFSCDVLREATGAEVAFMNAGGLRADLPEGPITLGNVQDAFPFLNTVMVVELTGAQIRQIVEQGLTLERGMIQVSGLVAQYKIDQSKGDRLLKLSIAGSPVENNRSYRVATNSFLAEGGDLYTTFKEGTLIKETNRDIAAAVVEFFAEQPGPVPPPVMGRLVPVRQ